MRKLALAAAVSFGLASVSSETFALGLGEIEIFSALNQNLDAEIGLISVAPGELDSITAGLASDDAFARAGLSMTPVLRTLRFDIEQRPDGAPIIKVYSDAPVVEPFLNFLVEAESLISTNESREYTVLLDPPAFLTEQQPVEADPISAADTNVASSLSSDASGDDVPDLLVATESNGLPDNGAQIDLSQVAGTTAQPTVVFTEQSADQSSGDDLLIGLTDLESEPLPGVQAPVIENVAQTGGEDINLGDELIGRPEILVEDESGSVDVSLNELADPDAIFATEIIATDDTEQNIIDLATIAQEDTIDALSRDASLVSDSVRQQGLDINLDPVEPASPNATVAIEGLEISADELGPDVIVPEVTLETVENFPLAQSSTFTDPVSNVEPVADTLPLAEIAEPSDRRVGLDVDLSDIDDSDASIPLETTQLPVAVTTPIVPAIEPPIADPAPDTAGEALDISGIVVEVPGNPQVIQPSVAVTTFTPSSGSSSYAVQREDTLWSIARKERPAGVSINQMMQAIVDANPRAFNNGDMNSLRAGSVLTIPGGTGAADVQSPVQSTTPSTAVAANNDVPATTVQPVATDDTVQTDSMTTAVVDAETSETGTVPLESAADNSLSTDLDEVNKKMMQAQDELTAEAQQRSELSSRVVELEDSLTKMQELITLRESELNNLQDEMAPGSTVTQMPVDVGSEASNVASDDTAQPLAEPVSTESDSLVSESVADVDDSVRELQQQINAEVVIAQDKVDAQADADRNLASAQAQVSSMRLANEEDALRQQLAQLQLEKQQLEQTAQADKLELVRQAEIEKARLLEQASAEREQILARLELEKERITQEAVAERARIAAEAEEEKNRLIAETQAERDQLAAEGEVMRDKLEELEAENNQLLAQAEEGKEQLAEATRTAEEEQAALLAEAEAEKQKFEEESTRVADKLAELQAEADANLANSTAGQSIDRTTENADTDAEGVVADLTLPAVAGGGLAVAPLEREIGDRKMVLAAGGGIALLGLLGAWAVRRRKPQPVVETRVAGGAYTDFAEDHLADPDAQQRENLYDRARQMEEGGSDRPNMGQAAVAASAAAAAAGAAVTTRDSDAVESRFEPESDSAISQDPVQEVAEEISSAESANAGTDNLDVADTGVGEDVPPMVEEVLVDDTITEADVYLRYGLHGQAEDLLKTAIEKSPEVPEYQVKLMESYHDQKNTEQFKDAAQSFKERFGESADQWDHVAQMGRNLDSSDNAFSRVGAMGAAGGAAVAGVVSIAGDQSSADELNSDNSNAVVSDESPVMDSSADSIEAAMADVAGIDDSISIDDTINADENFSISDLEATGDFSSLVDDLPDDLDEISLDEVDMAALDDDGTLNLEELTGDQMSGLDLGTLDLTNPEGDSTLDNLTLDDADLNSLGDLTSDVSGGLSTDIDLEEGTISRTDEMETMLDLAKAYIDMGDSDSAESALKDIITHGSDAQKMEAQDLLSKL